MKKILLFALLGVFAFTANAQIQGYAVGQTVNDFTVTDTKGNVHNLYTYTAAGKHVFLDFFFTTCPPCQATNPTWNEFYDKYGCNSGDVICISINSGLNNDPNVITYENTYGGSFNHTPAVSTDGGCTPVDSDFNPVAYPTYCLIGPDNQLKNGDIWPISGVSTFEAAFPSGFNPQPLACTVGIDENENALSLNVFPNPSTGHVNINYSSKSGISTIEVVDILGKVIYSSTVEKATRNLIHLDEEVFTTKGIYFVRISNGENTTAEKVIIQ
ncbi:MAG: T9SS type A sorting domain-containing protein [Bacteroidia bacterium]|nr:T9SS type A sorting domain-containing protein [Bacteroidia bacterium]NNC85385.1 T9SS type A sorting domain-containing protein [Bacteroidia bacterium]NNM15197.1 T9SS type A sorting domain-containing protein [Bacteroidia bacterium]